MANGETIKVEAITIETLKEPIKVYNFEVEDWHVYYVSNLEVLVHNKGGPCSADNMVKEVAEGGVEVTANANIRKFTEYIFKDGAAPGKDVVFKNLGYDINDSSALIKIYEEQAALKYAKGEYTLGKVDSFGQRIDIEIVLPGIGEAAGNTSYLKSGWMIKPDGSISLNTPFSGHTR